MTLKMRLAAMMVLILMVAMAFQYFVAAREQAELVDRLRVLSREVEGATRFASSWTHSVMAGAAPPRLEEVFDLLSVDGQLDSLDAAGVAIIRGDRPSFRHALLRTEVGGTDGVGRESAGDTSRTATWIERRELEVVIDTVGNGHTARTTGLLDTTGRVRMLDGARHIAGAPGGPKIVVKRFDGGPEDSFETLDSLAAGEMTFVVNLALPGADQDDPYTLQVLYPFDELVDELGQSRRRSLLWLAGLIGAGAVGATLVAARFTRPISSLQSSIRRVESGDFDVASLPEGDDEIGRVNSSFNRMVARLRESREMERRLGEAERMAALGRMAAGVAHEVRNPLNAMRLAMQQMRDRMLPAWSDECEPESDANRGSQPKSADGARSGALGRAEFERYYGLVTGELGRLNHLVGSFLDLTRSGELARERVDLLASLEQAVELYRRDAEARGVTLVIEVESVLQSDGRAAVPADAIVLADPARVASIWSNLIANALDASTAGGRIVARVTTTPDAVAIEFVDDGRGIDAALVERVWEPFVSGRSDGTGLGLSIVRAVVEQHGGAIELESEEGRGTRVRIRLSRQGTPVAVVAKTAAEAVVEPAGEEA